MHTFLLLTHTKQLVTFCDATAGIGVSYTDGGQTDGGQMAAEGQKDVEVEIVI